ncbi:type II toxin-antitoxin system VapC family toxin [Ectothiorhodospira haloalkaliphila]|uniref:type II toxin-antitoxin system VapC family toxin n=1 Tax=Ectothiorhodospira haloalkaliphila TaxID=421628 RepID=UPI001EE89FBF|nr:type II toxin-antitoxin system VapC family toxin [Ectothiorhodospira haloalkaliphila]MCG5523912.1 type II toxin-antitoxin system VapC family toxin [Ectothiorhodospira haloalkaliphila]
MIVVDSNIIAYLYLPSEPSAQAEQLLALEPHWAAPTLWRSEFRNILALYMRKDMLSLEQACAIQTEAETLLAESEYHVPSLDVFRLVETSHCSAYDCEFVALARRLDTQLVTADKKILKEFPANSMSLERAVSQF